LALVPTSRRAPRSLNDRSLLRLARDESRNSHTPETAVGLRLLGRSCRRLTPVATVSAPPAVERSLRSSACAIADRVSVLELSMSLLPFKRGSSTHRRLVWSEMFKMDHRRRLRLDKTLWPSEISCAPESLAPGPTSIFPFAPTAALRQSMRPYGPEACPLRPGERPIRAQPPGKWSPPTLPSHARLSTAWRCRQKCHRACRRSISRPHREH